MFKVLCCCSAILFTTGLSAQTTPKRFQLGVNYSADYAYRSLKLSNDSPYGKMMIEARNDSETAKYGYTTGLNVLFVLNEHIELGAGVQYSNKGYKIPDLLFDGIALGSYTQGKAMIRLHYIDIPLKANFVFGQGKWRGLAGVGIVANFLERSTVKTVSTGNGDRKWVKYTDTYNYNRFNLSPMISAGVDYTLNERMHVRVEPTFRYGVLRMTEQPYEMRVWNLGLNASCYFSL